MLRFFLGIFAFISLLSGAWANEIERVGHGPTYDAIKDRQVYAKAIYDFRFIGNSKAYRKRVAEKFVSNLVRSRFQNKEGNYILTLEVLKGGETVAKEPILSLTWKNNKFLFLNVSTETTFDTRSSGVLMADFPVGSQSNEFGLKINLLRSEDSAVDLTVLKELSKLAKVSTISQFAPGITTISDAYAPFEGILDTLLSRHSRSDITTQTMAAFTKLNDSPFGNQFLFQQDGFQLNIYFKTYNSQVGKQFISENDGFLSGIEPIDALETLKAGYDTARQRIWDVLLADSSDEGKKLSSKFLIPISSGKPIKDENTRTLCRSLKTMLGKYLSVRDAPLAYWSIMKIYSWELSNSKYGSACIESNSDYLKRYNLAIDLANWK